MSRHPQRRRLKYSTRYIAAAVSLAVYLAATAVMHISGGADADGHSFAMTRRISTALSSANPGLLTSWKNPLRVEFGRRVAPQLRMSSPAARQPAVGMFLIAAQKLRDPNFSETVVLLLHYGDVGTLGVVVNRRSSMTVAEVLPEIGEFQTRDDELYAGGPVGLNAVTMLVRSPRPPPESTRVLDEVYIVSEIESLQGLLGDGLPEKSLRVFAGHAGWAPGQLEAEIGRRDWYLRPASAGWVFNDNPESIWAELVRLAGLQIA